MDNIYDINPLKILVVNPYNSNVLNSLTLPVKSKIKGGDYSSRDKLQRADFSVLDEGIDMLKDVGVGTDVHFEGDPDPIMVYPFDNVINLRDKIFVATGIHPYRQHLLFTYSDKFTALSYSVYLGHDLVDCNIFNKMQNITDTSILNIPIDRDMANSKEDIAVDMNDTFVTLAQGGRHITRIIVCDLYFILNPSNDNIKNILASSEFQRNLIYYGFVIKFFPLLSPDAFAHLYVRGGSISSISAMLHPNIDGLISVYKREKTVLNDCYVQSHNMVKYYTKYKKKLEYAIVDATAEVKIPTLNMRNFFDAFGLNEKFVFVAMKVIINGKVYLVDKKYFLYTENVQIYPNRILVNSIIMKTNDGVNITIYKNTIILKRRYDESKQMNFADVRGDLKRIASVLVDRMNKLGLIVITGGGDKREDIGLIIINTEINSYWPENFSSDQFSLFRAHLTVFEDIGILTVLASPIGSYNCIVNRTSIRLNVEKKFHLLQQFPMIKNQYDYYTNTDFRKKWNTMAKKTLTFTQKASNTAISFSGFVDEDFTNAFYLVYGSMYDFVKKLKKTKHTIVVDRDTKVLAKLKGVDPELFNIKKLDPSYQVYAIKCQSERQPLIYRTHELPYLSKNIKDKIIKFWNYTDQKPVFYYCPNKQYPHLSFRPIDHPLGYCLPCCKKLIPSEGSRQSKIDQACYEKFILPHKEIEDIIKKIDRDSSHLLTYGKEISVGRYSKIPSIIEDNILLSKTLYRLLGVKQNMPLYKHGGFIFSIISCLGMSLEEFIRGIVKILNNNTLQVLDEGHTQAFGSSDQFKETFTNMLLDTNKLTHISDIHAIDWVNIISELTYMAYGYQIIIINDHDHVTKIRMLNTAQVCILNKDCDASYIITVSHDGGIYPLVELDNKERSSGIKRRIFGGDDIIVLSILEVLKKEHKKVDTHGIRLIDIIEFVENNTKYRAKHLLRGKRGLIYGAILKSGHNDVFVPCIYSEYVDKKYPVMCCNFPDTNTFKRQILYDFITHYNCYLIKKYRSKSVPYIDPVAVIRYKDKFVGIKVRYVDNNFGLTFYHGPEKTIGHYDVKVIDIPYSIMDVNDAISRSTTHEIHKDMGKYAYHNYVYSLFIIEFVFEIRKRKNVKIRTCLRDTLDTKNQVDRRSIKECLKDYTSDYNTIIELLATHQQHKVANLIDGMIFDFDMTILKKLLKLGMEQRVKEIEKLMEPLVSFSQKSPDISNILASCQIKEDLPQCSRGKLIIDRSNFDECAKLLSSDLNRPQIYETIMLRISDIRNELSFTKRLTEILHVTEL